MKNTNRRFWAALIIFSLTGQIAWVVENMYFNVFIYKMFNASAADIALMVQASAIAATLTTILIGALSDRLGKRKIFMCAGYIAWGISILAFAFIRVDLIGSLFGMTVGAASACISIVIIMDCVMTFFGSTANRLHRGFRWSPGRGRASPCRAKRAEIRKRSCSSRKPPRSGSSY